jgi:hypothetical protein
MKMAEMKEFPIDFVKSLDTHSVFLSQPDVVRRAKLIAIANSFISGLDPSKS